MFEKILVPLELAGGLGSEVILFHVQGPENKQYEHMHQIYLDTLAENLRHNIGKSQPQGLEVKVTTKVETGDARKNICTIVDRNDIGLIIMTAAGTSSLRISKMIGSVTDHICRTVPIPVMLIRPHNTETIEGRKRLINRILLPLDGSDLSKRALPIGQELANKLLIPITLFQMVNAFYIYNNVAVPFVDYEKINQDEMSQVRTEIFVIEKELIEKGLDVTDSVTLGMDAAQCC